MTSKSESMPDVGLVGTRPPLIKVGFFSSLKPMGNRCLVHECLLPAQTRPICAMQKVQRPLTGSRQYRMKRIKKKKAHKATALWNEESREAIHPLSRTWEATIYYLRWFHSKRGILRGCSGKRKGYSWRRGGVHGRPGCKEESKDNLWASTISLTSIKLMRRATWRRTLQEGMKRMKKNERNNRINWNQRSDA